MEYSRKLLIAKIMVTLAVIVYTVMPFLTRFDWTSVAGLLVFPVLMYALWGALHGTGRSVRLVAFLGLAYTVAYFLSISWLETGAPEGYLPFFSVIFVLLTLGVLFSLKRGKSSN